jgi:hypothetical protein
LQLGLDGRSRALTHGHHGNQSGNTYEHAQHGQPGAKFVTTNGA